MHSTEAMGFDDRKQLVYIIKEWIPRAINLKWYAKIIKHRTNAAKSEGLPCYLMKLIQARQRSIQFLHDPTIRRKKKKSPIHTDTDFVI